VEAAPAAKGLKSARREIKQGRPDRVRRPPRRRSAVARPRDLASRPCADGPRHESRGRGHPTGCGPAPCRAYGMRSP